MGRTSSPPILFGPFRLDPQSRSLSREGADIAIGGRAFNVLAALAVAGGQILSKDALLAVVWPGREVEENNLQVQISTLRKLLGEGWIFTIPGRGYRLLVTPEVIPPLPVPPVIPDQPSIAVLPFANLSGDPEEQFISDGVAEDILTELARDRHLFVIGRASSFNYRGAVDIRQVGHELGVRYVLDGSVRRAGARLRITARLNNTATGAAMWSERFDRDIRDIFEVQDEITAAITQAVGPAVVDAEQKRAKRKLPADLTAWEAYHRGLWHLLQLTEEQTNTAIVHLRHATELDPDFGSAWTAWSHAELALFGRLGSGDFAEGGRTMLPLAQRAISCDPWEPEGHVAMATALMMLGDMAGAWRAAREAERVGPTSPRLLQLLGMLHVFGGDRVKGRELLEDAMRRDPFNPLHSNSRANYSWSLFLDGEYETVLSLARQAIHYAPHGELWAYRHIAAALAELGRFHEAREALRLAKKNGLKLLALYMENHVRSNALRTLSASERRCVRRGGMVRTKE